MTRVATHGGASHGGAARTGGSTEARAATMGAGPDVRRRRPG